MLNFLYTPVSWVLLQWHHLFNVLGLNPSGGLNWALSIIWLVISARVLLFRLFIKQVKYQRQMAKLQPEMAKIKKKFKDDRAAQQRELMALQQSHGFNPLAGCLPMFLQWPIFLALYHVLRHMANSVALCDKWNYGVGGAIANKNLKLYSFTPTETCRAAQAKLFGAPLAGRITDSGHQVTQLGGDRGVMVAVILVLVLISAGATFTTQLLARKGNPVQTEGTAALVQRFMLYIIPVGTLGSGLFFPLGVLLYWFASNTWTMAQQLYINKYHPHDKPDDDKEVAGQVRRALAPRPGQKPTRPNRGSAGTATSLVKQTDQQNGSSGDSAGGREAGTPGSGSAGDGASGGARTVPHTPRPGQKPQRATKRPPAKRPAQAKKRR